MTVFYLPSCNFKAAHPDVSPKIQAYLRNKPDTEICGCCRVSQSKFHEGDTVLTNCVSCATACKRISTCLLCCAAWCNSTSPMRRCAKRLWTSSAKMDGKVSSDDDRRSTRISYRAQDADGSHCGKAPAACAAREEPN